MEPFLHLLVYVVLLNLLIFAQNQFRGCLEKKEEKNTTVLASMFVRLFEKNAMVLTIKIPRTRSHCPMPYAFAIVCPSI